MKPSAIAPEPATKAGVTPASLILLAVVGIGVPYTALRLSTRRRARSKQRC